MAVTAADSNKCKLLESTAEVERISEAGGEED
jgi:hypothetical protein